MIVKKQYAYIETLKDVPQYDASALGNYVRHSFAAIESSTLEQTPKRWCYCATFVFGDNVLSFTIPTSGMNNFDNVNIFSSIPSSVSDIVNSVFYVNGNFYLAREWEGGSYLNVDAYTGSGWTGADTYSWGTLSTYSNPKWNNGDRDPDKEFWETDRFTVEIDSNEIRIFYMNYPVGKIII